MIPYLQITHIPIGPFNLQVWGLWVALGILVAVWVGSREAKRRGVDKNDFVDMATLIVFLALVFGRLGHTFLYEPEVYLADPVLILKVWEGGMSSFGGFAGALIGALLFFRLRKVSVKDMVAAGAYATPLGYGIGRLGCVFIHDHPGVLSSSFIAVQYPGGARLDHGLMLSVLGFLVFGALYMIRRTSSGDLGWRYLWWVLLLYGVPRFFLDFYRAWDVRGADTRYFLLTPAQYGSIIMIIIGGYFLLRYHLRRKPV